MLLVSSIVVDIDVIVVAVCLDKSRTCSDFAKLIISFGAAIVVTFRVKPNEKVTIMK